MKLLAINKISRNLKMKRFKMPNAPYSNRCGAFPTSEKPINFHHLHNVGLEN